MAQKFILEPSLACGDCGDTRDFYVVKNATWYEAGLLFQPHCCRACLARRLGRPLVPSDFPPIPNAKTACYLFERVSNLLATGFVGAPKPVGIRFSLRDLVAKHVDRARRELENERRARTGP
jgi:hypothetical protein